jgi:FkbM family methyltransferase
MSTIVPLPAWDARFYLPPNGHSAGAMMIYAVRELYERELAYLGRLISPEMVVVDGGASYGIYTIAAARLVGPAGRVLSFEPGLASFSALQRNIALNGFENVRAFRAALADKDGTARLYHEGRGPTSFSLGLPGNSVCNWEEVETRALQGLLSKEEGNRVGLIKLDVEGAEELALRGALPLLTASRPSVIFEVNPQAAKQLSLDPWGAWRLLNSLRYSFYSFAENGDFRKLDSPPPVGNVVAIHSGRFA